MANIQLEKKKDDPVSTDRSVNFATTEPVSSEKLFKRSNFLGDYLKQERDDVIVGGYTPTVEDSRKLEKLLIDNYTLSHPSERVIESGNVINVPLCIGLKTLENVVWPYSIFGQVNESKCFK